MSEIDNITRQMKNFNKGLLMKKYLICLTTVFLVSCVSCPRPDTDMLRDQLKEYTLIVYKDDKINFYNERGLRPLLIRLNDGTFRDAFIADRIVGKASALLHVFGRVKEVYTPVISKPAVAVYEKYGIKYHADKVIDNIRNRTNTGLCPMEMKVQNIDDPAEAYRLFSKP